MEFKDGFYQHMDAEGDNPIHVIINEGMDKEQYHQCNVYIKTDDGNFVDKTMVHDELINEPEFITLIKNQALQKLNNVLRKLKKT